jgi:hypothetical protein
VVVVEALRKEESNQPRKKRGQEGINADAAGIKKALALIFTFAWGFRVIIS